MTHLISNNKSNNLVSIECVKTCQYWDFMRLTFGMVLETKTSRDPWNLKLSILRLFGTIHFPGLSRLRQSCRDLAFFESLADPWDRGTSMTPKSVFAVLGCYRKNEVATINSFVFPLFRAFCKKRSFTDILYLGKQLTYSLQSGTSSLPGCGRWFEVEWKANVGIFWLMLMEWSGGT